MNGNLPTLAILGGTGAEGKGLALRWAKAGYNVILGSRSSGRALKTALELMHSNISGTDNVSAVEDADVVVLAVPFSAQEETLQAVKDGLSGKILVDVTVPLMPPSISRVQLPSEGSAAQRAQSIVGPGVKVVSAFHNVSAGHLKDPEEEIDCDVLVFSDDDEARGKVATLVFAAGMRAWEGGALANSVAAEAMTSVLIAINRHYKIAGAGIRITGTATHEK